MKIKRDFNKTVPRFTRICIYKDWIKYFEISVLLYSQQEIQSGKIKNNMCNFEFPPLDFLVCPT